MASADLTVERVRELLSYNKETGQLTWRRSRGNRKGGAVAGSIDTNGYISVGIERRIYRAHRLAWLIVFGTWPEIDIDHIDVDKTNNRWDNLRLANGTINGFNRVAPTSRNKAGRLGVSKRGGSYGASIHLGRQHIWLGTFKTPEEAHAAYVAAKQKIVCSIS